MGSTPLRPAELLATPWRTAGDSLANCWRLLGELLVATWQTTRGLPGELLASPERSLGIARAIQDQDGIYLTPCVSKARGG